MAANTIRAYKELNDGTAVEHVEWFDARAERTRHQIEVTSSTGSAQFIIPRDLRHRTGKRVGKIFQRISSEDTFAGISERA